MPRRVRHSWSDLAPHPCNRTSGFPGGSVVKNPPAYAGDEGLIPGSGSCPGEENGNPLQYSCLQNPMDRGAWRATVYGVEKSDTTWGLNNSNKDYRPIFQSHTSISRNPGYRGKQKRASFFTATLLVIETAGNHLNAHKETTVHLPGKVPSSREKGRRSSWRTDMEWIPEGTVRWGEQPWRAPIDVSANGAGNTGPTRRRAQSDLYPYTKVNSHWTQISRKRPKMVKL